MKSQLRIGLSACFFHADPKRPIFKGKTLQYVEQSLAHWIQSQSALVYVIPAPESLADLSSYAEDLDGLVLQGGSDVSPTSYGEAPLKPEWSGDKIRDDYEIALLKEFQKRGKPILGVCRGLQLINVALGGTLYQDIATALPKALNHRNWDIYDENNHEITIESNSWLESWYQKTSARVNSVHHQAIKELGQNLKAEAWSVPDRLIEAIRFEGASWIYAIQWHPEFHERFPDFLNARALLEAFLKEAKKTQLAHS